MRSALVSVVLPTYNRAWCIERAVESVLSQSYEHLELIVVDNDSVDDTIERVQRFGDPRIRIIQLSNSGIIAKSRNAGIRCSHGKYIAFLDSDDIWEPQKLHSCVPHLDAGADLCFHWMSEIGSNKPIALTRALTKPVMRDLIVNGNAIATSSVVVSRKSIIEIGMFSEDQKLIAIEDYDAWVRLSRVTEGFVCVECVLGQYTLGVDGLLGGPKTNERRRMALEAIRERHHELHQAVLGYTPGWLLNALAKHYVSISLRTATGYNVECLLSKETLGTKAKSLVIQGMAFLYYSKNRLAGAYRSLLRSRMGRGNQDK